jgi:hypothetical protein
MSRAFGIRLLAATAALAGPAAASAQPAVAEPAKLDNMAQCAIDKHPNEARWLGALLAKKASVEPGLGSGTFLNAMGELLNGCLVDGSRFDLDAFVDSLRRFGESAPTGPARPGPMDALGDCFAQSAPQEAIAFLRESDIEAAKSFSPDAGGKVALKMGSISDSAFEAMLSKSSGCGPILDKLGGQVHGNQVYWRLNWRLRAEPQLGAGK